MHLKPNVNREILWKLLVRDQVSVESIAIRFGVSRGCVYDWLKKFDIPLRAAREVVSGR